MADAPVYLEQKLDTVLAKLDLILGLIGGTATPTPSPTPAPSPTPTPSAPATGLRIASAPNALAYDKRKTTAADVLESNSFLVETGPYGATDLAFAFHNVALPGGAVGNAVAMSEMTLTSPSGATRSIPGTVTIADGVIGVSASLKASDFGLTAFPANQEWTGKANLTVGKAGEFLPGSFNIRDKRGFTSFRSDAQGGGRTQVYNEVAIPQVVGKVPAGAVQVLIYGHSWFRGNDYVSASSRFGKGYLADIGEKAMFDPATGVVTPFINASKYGAALQPTIDDATDPSAIWAMYVTHAIDGFAYNETQYGLETMKASHSKLWSIWKKRNPSIKVFAMSVFGDGLSQKTGGLPEQYDAFLKESLAKGLIDGIIPLDSIRDPKDRTKALPGMLNASDHPTPGVGVEAIAAEIRKVVLGAVAPAATATLATSTGTNASIKDSTGTVAKI